MRSRFVGREAELGVIDELGRLASRDGRPTAVLVVGEAGLGKTRLLGEARSRSRSDGELTVTGYEPERAISFAAVTEMLGTLMRGRSGRRLEEVLRGPPDGVAGGIEPLRLFEAVLESIRPLAPLRLVMDDLQWVDAGSIALCHHLVRAAVQGGPNIVVLAASRPDPAAAAFADALRRLISEPDRLRVVELGPLGSDAGILLAMALVPELGSVRAERLWAAASGSPFWLETLARAGLGSSDLPQLLSARLHGLGADEGEALAALAVAARPATIAQLVGVLGWSEERVRPALAELGARGIVVEMAGNTQIGHDLLRAAVESRLDSGIRRRLHRGWGAVLEADAGDDPIVLWAALRHRLEGGEPVERLALRLVRSPGRRMLAGEGLTLLTHVADDPALEEGAGAALLEAIAVLATELGEHETAFARWMELLDHPPDTGCDPEHLQRALLGAAGVARDLRRTAEARSLLERARRAGTSTTLALVALSLEASILIWLEGRIPEGWRVARRAVRQARAMARLAGGVRKLDAETRQAYLHALEVGFEAAVQSDDVRGMRGLVRERAAGTVGFDPEGHVRALVSAGSMERTLGRAREAVNPLRRAWREARRGLYPAAAIDSGYYLASTLMELGDLSGARAVAAETSELVDRVGDRGRMRARPRMVCHEIAFLDGRRDAAMEAILADAADRRDPHHTIIHQEVLAVWLARLDGPAAAVRVEEAIATGEHLAELAGCPRCRREFELVSIEALVRIDRPEEAARALDRWEHERPTLTPQERYERMRAEALLALVGPDGRSPAAYLRGAIGEAERLGRRMDALQARLDLARTLGGVDRPEAIATLREVVRQSDEIGSAAYRGMAELGLRSLGVRTWRRGAAGMDQSLGRLTARELEVARLVAEGASNPEIGARLFLSRKTVERHVSNILAKVGVRNRTELAARLAEIGPGSTDGGSSPMKAATPGP